MKPNYRALSRAAPQQNFINDGDYMTDEKTQQPLGVASDLNAELEPTKVYDVRQFVQSIEKIWPEIILSTQNKEHALEFYDEVVKKHPDLVFDVLETKTLHVVKRLKISTMQANGF